MKKLDGVGWDAGCCCCYRGGGWRWGKSLSKLLLRPRVLDCLNRGFLVGHVLVQVPVKPVSVALELPVLVVLGAGAILVAIEPETAEAVAVVSGVLTVTAELAADELALVLLEPKSQVNFTQTTVVVWSNILAGGPGQ